MTVDWVQTQFQGATRALGSAQHLVVQRAGTVVDSARASAQQLYNQGQSAFTQVDQVVSQKVERIQSQAGAALDDARGSAADLYDRGKAGLSQVGESLADPSNLMGKLKYANPSFYQGKGLEIGGEAAKLFGRGCNLGVDFLDKHSKILPENLKMEAGKVAGVMGLAGSLTEGAGGMAVWAGRVVQGDTKTIEGTRQGVQKGLESLAYVDGKVRSAFGSAVERVGEKTDSALLRDAGRGYRVAGEARSNLAGEDTKKALDAVGQAGAHYAAKVSEAGGGLVQTVGEKTGSRTLQEMGGEVRQEAAANADRNANGLTRGIDQAVQARLQEYRENGNYAVTRDLTRVTGELVSLVVAPETHLAKVGKVAKTAEGLEDIALLGRGADEAVEAGRLAPRTLSARNRAELEQQGQRLTQDLERLHGDLKAEQTPSPQLQDDFNRAHAEFIQASSDLKDATRGPEKGAAVARRKAALERLGKLNKAMMGDPEKLTALNKEIKPREQALSRIGDVAAAPAEGYKLSSSQQWFDGGKGAAGEHEALARHVKKHRDELGISPDASEAEATQQYLQIGKRTLTQPSEDIACLMGANAESPSLTLFDPKTRIRAIYKWVGDGYVPTTIHTVAPTSAQFPHGHKFGVGNDWAEFLASQ